MSEVSLVEAWSLMCAMINWLYVYSFFFRMWKTYNISHVQTILFILPISYSRCVCSDISSFYHYNILYDYKDHRSTKMGFYNNYKKTDKKRFCEHEHLIIAQFSLLIF